MTALLLWPLAFAADVALDSTVTRRPLLGPGGRLTFTRRNRGKETSRA